jgi:hypothetical protein
MNIDIQAAEDDFFKMSVVKFGEQHLASNGENIAIAPTPEEAIEKVEEQSQPQPVEVQRGPKGVPLNNHSSSSHHWFEGTSWSTNNR